MTLNYKIRALCAVFWFVFCFWRWNEISVIKYAPCVSALPPARKGVHAYLKKTPVPFSLYLSFSRSVCVCLRQCLCPHKSILKLDDHPQTLHCKNNNNNSKVCAKRGWPTIRIKTFSDTHLLSHSRNLSFTLSIILSHSLYNGPMSKFNVVFCFRR